jgi:hypothetical protein
MALESLIVVSELAKLLLLPTEWSSRGAVGVLGNPPINALPNVIGEP